MAEFEAEVTLEDKCDIEVDFSEFSSEEKVEIILAMFNNDTWTFTDMDVEVSGETIVDIEPPDYH